jgi:hypothetical protein
MNKSNEALYLFCQSSSSHSVIDYAKSLIIYLRHTNGGVEGRRFLICSFLVINAIQVHKIINTLKGSLDAIALQINLKVDR